MTADASRPPAGVQRPTAPLTDEELASIERGVTDDCYTNLAEVGRLIADLRASRAEMERQFHRAYDYSNAMKAAQAELRARTAEVERLAALNDGLHAALQAARDLKMNGGA